MSTTAPDTPEIRDYLLRRMTETDRARFEEAYFRDDRLLDRIESEEDVLVSDYVLGRLPDSERRLFEESLLDTPYYRDRVETTRGIKLRLAEERFFRKKTAAAAPSSSESDPRLFPGGTGVGIAFGLLVLLLIASLASAWFLKIALARTRKELADQRPHAGAAAQAGIVPLAQTIVLRPESGTGPSIVRLKRPAGGAILLVFPRTVAAQGEGFGVALAKGEIVVWDSGELPAKGFEDGDLSLRLPPGVPPAGAYAVRLRVRGASGPPQETFLGTIDIAER
ncbi:MAG: hypothetical protein WCC53_06215 [Thermoanaerobaculia bacterium]